MHSSTLEFQLKSSKHCQATVSSLLSDLVAGSVILVLDGASATPFIGVRWVKMRRKAAKFPLFSLSLMDDSKSQCLRIVCLEVSHVAQQNWLYLITDCGQIVANVVLRYLVVFAVLPCLSSLFLTLTALSVPALPK